MPMIIVHNMSILLSQTLFTITQGYQVILIIIEPCCLGSLCFGIFTMDSLLLQMYK